MFNLSSLQITAIAAIAAFAAGGAGAWRVTSWAYQAGEREALEQAQQRHAQQIAERDAAHESDMAKTRGVVNNTLAAAAADRELVEQLREQLATLQLVESQEVPSVEGKCTDYRRGDRFRLCFNAALSGDAAAVAACSPDRVPAAVPGKPVSAAALVQPGF